MSRKRPGDDLLDGPRGRRVCLSLLTSAHDSLWQLAFHAARSPADGELTRALTRAITEADVADPGLTDETALLDALEVSTNAARYWQGPDDLDALLTSPQLRSALGPVAHQIGESASVAWWSSPIALDSQRYVQWTDESPLEPPALSGAADRLDRWRTNELSDERRAARRPKAVDASFSGEWWSTPALARLTTTSRSRPDLGAISLRLTEDALSYGRANVWPLRPAGGCRIYEITDPTAWTKLVARYPMDVSLSRRHDWWQATGHDGSWSIPDWAAVSSDFDAVHLTVTGYLTTAGRALPVGNSASVLAGWAPDQTYWLGDVLESAGDPVEWRLEDRRSKHGRWSRGIPDSP
ncbi:MAG: hypothetical protein JWP05_143 [Microbacteriaceae bacterium]|jgi:hypothetical protein|nr:hypothetical protein [Microbacteriaceae bacterium]